MKAISIAILLVSLKVHTSTSAANTGWTYDPKFREILEVGDRCNLTNREIGICRFIPDCKLYYDGLQSKTIEYNTLKRCSLLGFEEIICCPTEGFDFRRTKGSDIPITMDTMQPTERPSEAACRNYTNINPGKIIYHIMGGTPVGLGEFPHMGAVLSSNDPIPVLHCGSSLISEQYVLTAAHCFRDPLVQAQVIRFGTVRLNSTDIQPVDTVIDKVYIHPQYRYPASYHDIAVIKLKTPIMFSPFVRPACLHNNVADIDSLIQLFVTGWGVTNITTKTLSDVLLKTNVTWVSTRKCAEIYEKEILTRKYKNGLTHGQACAHDPQLKNDACWSDSGGPLQMVVNNISTIVGIVSFGKVCATTTPAVYTRVASYLNWIECLVWPTEEQKRIGNCSNVI